jgi:pyridoxal phosphate enzyme (YggS family)
VRRCARILLGSVGNGMSVRWKRLQAQLGFLSSGLRMQHTISESKAQGERAETIAERLCKVRERIQVAALAAKRDPARVRLVAVSKTHAAGTVREAYDAGQRHFGENYVQELVEKAEQLPTDINWHFIGHLQSNKVRTLLSVPNLWCVETVDRPKLANTLNRLMDELRPDGGPIPVMVQVNVSGEASKAGIEPAAAPELVEHILQACPRLKLLGLMTIGSPDPSPEPVAFQRLSHLRDQIQDRFRFQEPLELSMGMSDDFEAAVRMGSTNVRIGSTIFGPRVYPQ